MQVLAVLICMATIISKVDVDWGRTFQGYLPSKYVFTSGGLYTCERLYLNKSWQHLTR
jgi:metal iron transporter